jgi:putative ABC transport system ATP-binding protein
VSDPAIEIRELVKYFDGRGIRVLDGVDLSMEPGELVAITGPSGCGKSTLLHLIAALDRPTAGSILVNGKNLARRHRLDRYRREEISILFQLHNLLPLLKAHENVEIAMFGTGRNRTEREERARALLSELGLADVADRVPATLSGGERQRVAIARALANDPPILLADEPTSSLDDESAAIIVRVLDRRRDEEAKTTLVATHDARVIAAADRVVRLEGGVVTPYVPA